MSKNAEALSVIDNFVRAADIVREPKKTKIIGSMNFSANVVASVLDVILRPVVSSYPTLSHTQTRQTRYAVAYDGINSVPQQ